MDNEEFDQIPWSSLVADKTEGVDKRVYLAVGVVGVIVAVIFGSRLLGGSSTQPVPALDAVAPMQTVAAVTATTVGIIVSEADLMADAPATPSETDNLRAVAFAEWFVTDYYTTDGSSENEVSALTLMSPSAARVDMPHSADPPPATTYVEWARTVALRPSGDDQFEVDVAYRTITETEEGFVRDPVAAVVVTMRIGTQDPGVLGVPVPIAVPTLSAPAAEAGSG